MKRIIFLLTVFILVNTIYGEPAFGKWRVAHTSMNSQDKIEHGIRDYSIFLVQKILGKSTFFSYITTTIFSIIWECKDAIMYWEKHRWWGGDGFDPKDIIAGQIPVLSVIGLEIGVNKLFKVSVKSQKVTLSIKF